MDTCNLYNMAVAAALGSFFTQLMMTIHYLEELREKH